MEVPKALYRVSTELWLLVQNWSSLLPSGPAKGRLFEDVVARFCERRGYGWLDKPRLMTLMGSASMSGLRHENDGFYSGPSFNVHCELKYLSQPLGKNDLLVFNQKSIDYLLADQERARKKPLYRLIVSGSPLSEDARRFALIWGIQIVERDRVPLLTMLSLAHHPIHSADKDREARKVLLRDVPHFVSPLQSRLRQIGSLATNTRPFFLRQRLDRFAIAPCHGGFEHRLLRRRIDEPPEWLKSLLATLPNGRQET